jgi:hypothetical protein
MLFPFPSARYCLPNAGAFTVIDLNERQPVAVTTNDIVVVPALIPATEPVVLPTVPTAVLLLLHVPPLVAQASVVEEPTTTLEAPVIAAGSALITTTLVL